jgi:hypothetical protein
MRAMTGWIQLITLGALLIGASALATAGDMYRWVDAEGQVHYSDEPPPSDAKDVKSMRNKGVDPSPQDQSEDSEDSEAPPSYVEQQAAFEERQAKKAEEQAKAEQQKKLAAEQKKNCEAARGNYNTVSSGGRVMRVNAQGEREYLSDEEIKKETIEARKSMEEMCKGVN